MDSTRLPLTGLNTGRPVVDSCVPSWAYFFATPSVPLSLPSVPGACAIHWGCLNCSHEVIPGIGLFLRHLYTAMNCRILPLKIICLGCLLGLLLSSPGVQAQQKLKGLQPGADQYFVKGIVIPLGLVIHGAVAYEMWYTRSVSMQFSAGFWRFNGENSFTSLNPTIEMRKHYTNRDKKWLLNAYITPYVSNIVIWSKNETETLLSLIPAPGVAFGKAQYFARRWSIDFNVGGGPGFILRNQFAGNEGVIFLPRIQVFLGYRMK